MSCEFLELLSNLFFSYMSCRTVGHLNFSYEETSYKYSLN